MSYLTRNTLIDCRFLWASSQIEQLSRLKTKGAIEAALTSLPRGLYDTYHRILNEIPREHETISLRALQWLAHSTSPLDLEDLVEAIAIELNDDCKNLDQLDRLITPEDIFQICSSLVRRSEVTNKLSLAHHSVYEYLTLDSTKDDVPTPYHIPLPACQKYLTLSCLKYLSLDQFKSTSPQFNAEETIKLPFLRYALTNWWKHLPSDQSAMDEIWPSLEIFFDNNSGAFASSMVLLRQLEGEYRYPASIKPIHFCTMHGVAPLFPFLLKSSVPIDQPLEDGRRSIHIAAENGREDMVNLLLCHHIDTSVQTFDGRTPLQLAMETGSEEITSQLITGGVDINLSFSTGDIPLTLAVANNWYPVIQSLLENGADVNLALLDGRTALHIAAEAGANDATLILLLDRGADVYSEDLSRWTPLHYCTHFHHVSLARMILKENVNYLFDGKRWGPLHMAVEEENDELLELFEEFALNISIDAGRQYPLDMQSSPISDDPYAGMTDEELVRMKKGKHSGKATLPMRYRESSGEQLSRSRSLTGRQSNFVPSPLLLAVSQSYLPGIDILLRAGVDDRDLKFSMWHLFSQGNSEVLYKLTVAKVVNCRIFLDFETGLAADTAKIPHSVNSYLQSWGITRHIDLIRLLLAKCSIPISNENLECLKALVTKLPPHATLGQHQAKLVECLKEARKTHTAEVVEIFVEYGADWKELARDEILTLVSPAIISGNATLVKALLKHLAQTFGPNSWALPRPWLMAAAGNGFQNIVQTLLEAGAQWKDLTHNQMFSVIESITTRGVDRYYFSDLITQYLRKEHGADSDEIRDRDLKTRANAIIKVMLNQTHDAVPQMFESFVRAGIEIESGVRFQNATRDPISLITTHGPRLLGSLLHCAVLARNTRILSFLLEHDLKPDRRDSMGRTALHYAVQVPEGDIIVSLLLFKGADPCAGEGDNDGISPLHVSIAYGMDSHTQTLLNVGASLYQQDKSGRTPLHYCVSAFVEGVDWPSPLIETLLLDGGLQRMRSNDGLTPMEAALYASLQKTSSTLIEAVLKQDPDLATRVLPSGCTALHDAARMNCPNSVLQALLTNGASVRALDRSGRTPIDIAQVEAKEYLQSRRR